MASHTSMQKEARRRYERNPYSFGAIAAKIAVKPY
jgi:hypothetical protein